MYKTAIPIGLDSIEKYGFENGLERYAKLCRQGEISRVFRGNPSFCVNLKFGSKMII